MLDIIPRNRTKNMVFISYISSYIRGIFRYYWCACCNKYSIILWLIKNLEIYYCALHHVVHFCIFLGVSLKCVMPYGTILCRTGTYILFLYFWYRLWSCLLYVISSSSRHHTKRYFYWKIKNNLLKQSINLYTTTTESMKST